MSTLSIHDLARLLETYQPDWERSHQTQPFRPKRRKGWIGL